MFIFDVLPLYFRYSLSVATRHNFTLVLYAINLIGTSRRDGLECFCSSIGMNVYESPSASKCCIQSGIFAFILKPFSMSNRISSCCDRILPDNISLHPRLATYDNTSFMSQVQVYLGFAGFVLKTPLINLLINGCSDISGNTGSVTIVFSVLLYLFYCIYYCILFVPFILMYNQ